MKSVSSGQIATFVQKNFAINTVQNFAAATKQDSVGFQVPADADKPFVLTPVEIIVSNVMSWPSVKSAAVVASNIVLKWTTTD